MVDEQYPNEMAMTYSQSMAVDVGGLGCCSAVTTGVSNILLNQIEKRSPIPGIAPRNIFYKNIDGHSENDNPWNPETCRKKE